MHALSAAEPGSSALTALPTLGLLNRVHDYASAALGRNALSALRFRLFASTTRELSGLAKLRLKPTRARLTRPLFATAPQYSDRLLGHSVPAQTGR